MSLLRVLAMSSSRTGNYGYLEKAAPVIESFLGRKSLRIAFIPFASVDGNYPEYLSMVRKGFQSLPHQIELITSSLIENCDVIMTGGGNTFKLLHDLYCNNLLDLIRDKVHSGTPYIGWSAGSNITAATIKTTNDMPVIEPPSFNALGFFAFQINPHYHNFSIEGQHGETRDQRLTEFMILNPGSAVVGLPEGSALHLEGGVLKFIGEVEGVLFVTKGGKIEKKEIDVGEDLSFLL